VKRLFAWVIASAMIGGMGVALAADLPVKAPPPPVVVDMWTGWYIGANVGGDWGRDKISSDGTPGFCSTTAANCITFPNGSSILSANAATFNTSLNRSGVIGGGQIGYNWKVNNAVVGVEFDFQGKSDSKTTTYSTVTPDPNFAAFPMYQTYTQTDRINSLGTLRGRAGFLWGPSTLFYGTAGVAFANVKTTSTFLQNEVDPPALLPFGSTVYSSTERWGGTVGAGIEWKWSANWSFKVEYLYADFGRMTSNVLLVQPNFVLGGLQGTANAAVSTHVYDNIARVGINYAFGGPVVAKY